MYNYPKKSARRSTKQKKSIAHNKVNKKVTSPHHNRQIATTAIKNKTTTAAKNKTTEKLNKSPYHQQQRTTYQLWLAEPFRHPLCDNKFTYKNSRIYQEFMAEQLPTYGADTDPTTGITTHAGYEGVAINPELLFQTQEEKEKHYAKAWALWKDEMNEPLSICAPMVEQSELPFRLLSRKYNTNTAYTPMINSNAMAGPTEKVHHVKQKNKTQTFSLDHVFATTSQDRPLTVQICGANIDKLLQLAEELKDSGATDFNINLGCPQNIAKRGRYGSFLLEETLHVQRIVWALSKHVKIPITVKMRKLLNDPDHSRTLAYAKALQDSGAHAIILHGRTRNNKQDLIGQADLDAIKKMKEHLQIPVFGNGGVGSFFDLIRIKEYTSVDSVMISEALLNYPTMNAYPIRRSQLLPKVDRAIHEEALYQNATDLESPQDRAHYGYALFDRQDLKDLPFNHIHPVFKSMPLLNARTNVEELKLLDQLCGPDQIHIGREMLHLTRDHGAQWYSALRPHIFKLLQRELYIHTDARHLYSGSHLYHNVDPHVLQIVRTKQLHTFELYKKHCLDELKKFLGLPEDTPMEQIDTTNVSEDDLNKILSSFDLAPLVKYLDAIHYDEKASEMEATSVDNNNSKDTTSIDSTSVDATTDTTATTTNNNNNTTPALPKLKLPPNPWLTDDAWKIINIKYKLGTNKPYPVTVFNKENWLQTFEKYCVEQGYLEYHTIEFEGPVPSSVTDDDVVVVNTNNKTDQNDTAVANVEKINDTNTITMQKHKLTVALPAIRGFDINWDDIGLYDTQTPPQKQNYTPGMDGPFKMPTRWTPREIQDEQWVRLFKLDKGPGTTNGAYMKAAQQVIPHERTPTLTKSKEELHKEFIEKQLILHKNKFLKNFANGNKPQEDVFEYDIKKFTNPECAEVDYYVPPFPLEATYFIEKLLATQMDWYYRHGHIQEVKHVFVKEESIKSQIVGMKDARIAMDNLEGKSNAKQKKGNQEPPRTKEDFMALKQEKLLRKQQQRELELRKKLQQQDGTTNQNPQEQANDHSTTISNTMNDNIVDNETCCDKTQNLNVNDNDNNNNNSNNDNERPSGIRADRPPASDDDEIDGANKKQRTE